MLRTTARFIPLAPTPRVLAAARNASSTSKIPSKDDVTPTSKEPTRPGSNDEIAQDPAAFSADPNPATQMASVGREARSALAPSPPSTLPPHPSSAPTTTTSTAASTATASAAAAVSTNDWSEIGGMVVMGGFWF